MRTRVLGSLIAVATLVAAFASPAAGQTPTTTPTGTATPSPTATPEPTPTPEEEKQARLRNRKIVKRVYRDFRDNGRIDNCDHTRTALKRTLQSISDEFDQDFPDFREAVKAAIKDHDKERCVEEAEPEPT